MKLQRDRLAEKKLEMNYEIYSRNEGNNRFIAGSNWRDAHYESTVCFNFCGIKRKLIKYGKQCYSDELKSVLYETVTDVINGAHPDNDPVSCPNCGSVYEIATDDWALVELCYN